MIKNIHLNMIVSLLSVFSTDIAPASEGVDISSYGDRAITS